MLERALELAERGRGTTHPNPVVGAVVVREGVVGEGWHERKGGPHAEMVALDAAERACPGRDSLRDARALPASGETPPCTKAVREAGSRSSPARSIRTQRRAGASRSCEMRESRSSSRPASHVLGARTERCVANLGLLRRPFVTYKAAVTLDGRVTVPGNPLGLREGRQRLVHELRAASDAVAVGLGTVRADSLVSTPATWTRHAGPGDSPSARAAPRRIGARAARRAARG